MSDQDLHDDIENIVTTLQKFIPVLQDLGDSARDNVDKKLDGSLDKIKSQISDLSDVIQKLQEGAESNERFIKGAKDQALDHLKKGVELLIDTEVKSEYSNQIEGVIAAIVPLIISKINGEIENLVAHKQLSISDHNDKVDSINTTLESTMAAVHSTLLENIDKLNTANVDATTRYDGELNRLSVVATAHTESLETVQKATTLASENMQKTLKRIERNSVFMSQSPATMTAITVGFLAVCLLMTIVYVNKLWLPMLVSMSILGVLSGCIWGAMVWIDKRQQ